MSIDDGKLWILRQLRHVLTAHSVQLRQPFTWRYPAPNWRKHDPTHEYLIFTVAGQTKSIRLEIPRSVMEGCGAGAPYQRQLATQYIVEHLATMHLL
jgi:hypothetical protein